MVDNKPRAHETWEVMVNTVVYRLTETFNGPELKSWIKISFIR